ncbi:MAG: 4-(cytidine 5'-diphospho)-2-C-methyl-D-erythritol kinase [Ilumatobacter sp.]|uniref:4-(cytidine 5'-diphospho)-2-C-methyl-D-erythritol kinase n=1 Tax=Ilumatobacter sp. TaxID=1967498 RepID=UPI00391D3286
MSATPARLPEERSERTPDEATPIELRAHAKLTRTLRMTGLRDDGYHLIDAEMVSLALHDVLVVDPARTGLAATGPFAAGMPTDHSNLVAKALRLIGADAHVTIDKRIPHGGGLGGGSTDAAAVLRWGGFGTNDAALVEASRLGADIPFCMVGGRARVTGIGEIIEPLPQVDLTITLVIPPLAVSTPAAYRAWDDLGGPTGDGPNDLEVAAITVEPRLAWWRDAIAERTGTAPVLAGSGATWFVDGQRDDALADLVDEGARLVVTTTISSVSSPFDL